MSRISVVKFSTQYDKGDEIESMLVIFWLGSRCECWQSDNYLFLLCCEMIGYHYVGAFQQFLLTFVPDVKRESVLKVLSLQNIRSFTSIWQNVKLHLVCNSLNNCQFIVGRNVLLLKCS